MALISLRKVEKQYQLEKTQAPALLGVDLDIGPGEASLFF